MLSWSGSKWARTQSDVRAAALAVANASRCLGHQVHGTPFCNNLYSGTNTVDILGKNLDPRQHSSSTSSRLVT